METVFRIGAGLMVLGLGFVAVDFFLSKLLLRMYPDPNYWNEELSSPNLTQEKRQSLEKRRNLYRNAISHHFSKGGIVLLLVGSLLLAMALLVRVLK